MSEWLRGWRKDIGLARAGYEQMAVWPVGCLTCAIGARLRRRVLLTFFYRPYTKCNVCRHELSPPSWTAQAYEGHTPLVRCMNHRCSRYGLHIPRG